MDTVNIRLAITRAIAHEKRTDLLASHLASRITRLHRAIRFSSVNPINTLVEFVVSYAQHVAEFLDALNGVGPGTSSQSYRSYNQPKCLQFIEPLVEISAAFFIRPPEMLKGHAGLFATMSEAYLAHRLFEEVNSHFVSQCGASLAPVDMTRSNLIIHHLIGEPFANQLDDAVPLIAQGLESEQLLAKDGQLDGSMARELYSIMEAHQQPCFTDTLSVNLLFSGSEYGESDNPPVLH